MPMYRRTTDKELDREKYYGGPPAALERSLKEDINLGVSVSLSLLLFFPPKVTFTVAVDVCHQKCLYISACELLSASFCAALGNPCLLVAVRAITLRRLPPALCCYF